MPQLDPERYMSLLFKTGVGRFKEQNTETERKFRFLSSVDLNCIYFLRQQM